MFPLSMFSLFFLIEYSFQIRKNKENMEIGENPVPNSVYICIVVANCLHFQPSQAVTEKERDGGGEDGSLAGVDILFHDFASHSLPSVCHSTVRHTSILSQFLLSRILVLSVLNLEEVFFFFFFFFSEFLCFCILLIILIG